MVALHDLYRIFETNEFIDKLNKISIKERSVILTKLQNSIYPQLRNQ